VALHIILSFLFVLATLFCQASFLFCCGGFCFGGFWCFFGFFFFFFFFFFFLCFVRPPAFTTKTKSPSVDLLY